MFGCTWSWPHGCVSVDFSRVGSVLAACTCPSWDASCGFVHTHCRNDSCVGASGLPVQQLFFNFFKTLIGKPVVVELKNDLELAGVLQSVDQYLNLKLDGVSVVHAEQHPQLVRCAVRGHATGVPHRLSGAAHTQLSVKNCFIRGSTVRYVQVPRDEVDTELLQEAARTAAAAGGGR